MRRHRIVRLRAYRLGLLVGVFLLPAASLAGQPGAAGNADIVRQLRATADAMEGKLSREDIAELRRSADELEREGGAGNPGSGSMPADPADVAERIEREHGKVDWLDQKPACVGYGWENYRSFRLKSGDRDGERDILCHRAFGYYADYMARQRSGDFAGSRVSLAAYESAAHAAVDFFEGRSLGPKAEEAVR